MPSFKLDQQVKKKKEKKFRLEELGGSASNSTHRKWGEPKLRSGYKHKLTDT